MCIHFVLYFPKVYKYTTNLIGKIVIIGLQYQYSSLVYKIVDIIQTVLLLIANPTN